MKLFADDLKLYAAINTELDAANFQKYLDIIYHWSTNWQLDISLHKCFIIMLDRHAQSSIFKSYCFKLGNHVIEYKSTVRDLGLEVDEKLAFTDHISKITMTAHQRSNLIFRFFNSKDPHSLVFAFNVYVRSLLEYNSQVWSPIAMADIICIEKVQKQFTKRISGCEKLNYHQRLTKLNLESLEVRRLRADLKFMYKLIFKKVDLDYSKFFILQDSSNRQLRSHNFQIRPIHSLTNLRSNHCLFYRAATIWNALPPKTNFSSLNSFSTSIPADFLIRYCKFNFE